MKFKIGDRVKIKWTTERRGMIVFYDSSWQICPYKVAMDSGDHAFVDSKEIVRLVKKKKQTSAVSVDTPIAHVLVTKESLAKAWDKFVWCNNHAYRSADSALFEAFCKEINLA